MLNVNQCGSIGTSHHDIHIATQSPNMFGDAAVLCPLAKHPGLWFLAISSTGTLYGASDVTHVRSVLHHQLAGLISAGIG